MKNRRGEERTKVIKEKPLVWIPSKKALGSYDVEHQNLIILHDADWKKFNKSPSVFIDSILDGEYEIDEAD